MLSKCRPDVAGIKKKRKYSNNNKMKKTKNKQKLQSRLQKAWLSLFIYMACAMAIAAEKEKNLYRLFSSVFFFRYVLDRHYTISPSCCYVRNRADGSHHFKMDVASTVQFIYFFFLCYFMVGEMRLR